MKVFRSALLVLLLASHSAQAVDIVRDPQCGAGFCDVDNLSILGAPAGIPLDVDVLFPNLKHIETDSSGAPTTNAEFSINNTGNSADLHYEITMDLGDLNGNALTSGLLVHKDTAPAGLSHIVNMPLTPVPAGLVFNEVQFSVETECAVPGACSTFDFLAAGGGGSSTAASGPIRFNRAQGGFSIPEPGVLPTAWVITAFLSMRRSRRDR